MGTRHHPSETAVLPGWHPGGPRPKDAGIPLLKLVLDPVLSHASKTSLPASFTFFQTGRLSLLKSQLAFHHGYNTLMVLSQI